MAINTEVYGASETWQNSFVWTGSTQPWTSALHASRPKVPHWIDPDNPGDTTYATSQLRKGIKAGKIQKHIPIDKSICPLGQSGATFLKSFEVYAKQQREGEASATVRRIGTGRTVAANDFTTPVNTFWFESNMGSGTYRNRCFSKGMIYIDDEQPVYVWSPDGEDSGNNDVNANGNFWIAPLTYFESRSFIFQILVYVHDQTYDPDRTYTSEPTGSWRTLDNWKANYNTHAISGCQLSIRTVSGYNSSSGVMSYYKPEFGSSEYRKMSAALADELKFEIDDGTVISDICDYGLLAPGSNSQMGIRLFGGISGLYTWTDSLKNIGLVPSIISNYVKFGTDSVFPVIPYSDDIYEIIMSAAACFGIPFTPAKNTGYDASNCTFNQNFTDPDLCLPEIADNGVTYGEYTRGSDNVNNSFIDLVSQWDKNYDPVNPQPIDPNTYSNTTGFNSLTSGATATLKYVLDSGNVRNLLTDLWTISHNIAGADYENYDYKILDSFLVSNPIDSIVSLKRFPFDIPHTFSTQKTNVCLGKNTGSSQGYITHDVFNTVVFSGKRIYAKFGGSFLDYAPYTEYELYIPFCGTVKLNAGDILGHVLNCRLQIDLTTGTCTAYILADDLVIETATGVVSCELQVAGTDSATVDSNIQNAVLDHIGARTNKEVSLLSPLSVGGLMSAAANPWKASASNTNAQTEVDRAEYALTHIQTPVHSMGNAGGLTGWYQEFNARLIIYYPEGEAIDSSAPVSSTSPHLADLTAYAHNVGFACVLNGTVSEFHGKTVGNIDTSSIVGATEEERAQIKALFAQGVWLP